MQEPAAFLLPPQPQTALRLLAQAGFEGVLVGGAVRDLLCGVQPKDWDLATNALPEETRAVFAGYPVIDTGLKHGTVTVVIDRMPLEVTTYRVDGAYTDHRRPDGVAFTRSLPQDLARRDFTINAMAYDPARGLIDPYGGRQDLAAGLLRCVGEPARRFEEDALRMLRAARFCAQKGLTAEPATAAAVLAGREGLRAVSAERVLAELTQLLCGAWAKEALLAFGELLAVPMPELAPLFGFAQQNPHHDRDVWAHTTAVVGSAPPQPALRWAALLHDIGKPACFTQDPNGVGHFYGHAQKSCELAGALLRRLRMDTATRSRVLALVQYHDLPLAPDKKQLRRLLNRLGGEEPLRQLIALHRADTMGQAPCCQGRLALYDQTEAALAELLAGDACFSLRDLAVNGRDMAALGLAGREIGGALRACLDAVLEGELPNEREALLGYAAAQSPRPDAAPKREAPKGEEPNGEGAPKGRR